MPMVVNGVQYLSTRELHQQTGITLFYLRKLARKGTIPAKKVLNRWYYDYNAFMSEVMKDNSYSQSANNVGEDLINVTASEGSPSEIDLSDLE